MGAASKLLIVSFGVATAIGAPQPDPLLYTNPGLSYLSTQHVPYNYQFYRRGIDSRDRCLPNTYEDNTVHSYQIGNDHFYTTDLTEIGVTNVGMVGNHGYKYEGVLGYCFSNPTTGTKPLHR